MKSLQSVFLACFILLSSIAHACSCIRLGEISKEEIDRTASIFVGKAISVELEPLPEDNGDVSMLHFQQKIITFKVMRGFKNAKRGRVIEVRTARDSAACGIYVVEGDKWFVFADSYDNVLSTNSCSRSRKINGKNYREARLRTEIKFTKRHI